MIARSNASEGRIKEAMLAALLGALAPQNIAATARLRLSGAASTEFDRANVIANAHHRKSPPSGPGADKALVRVSLTCSAMVADCPGAATM